MWPAKTLPVKRHTGFTLLETIVALVIFSSSAMALAGLLNTNLITLTRVQEVTAQVPVLDNVIAHVQAMQVTQEGAGQFDLNRHTVHWEAKLLEPYRQSQNPTGYIGYHRVGLYQIEFTLEYTGKLVGEYTLRRVGFELVRGPSL